MGEGKNETGQRKSQWRGVSLSFPKDLQEVHEMSPRIVWLKVGELYPLIPDDHRLRASPGV